MKKMPSSKTDTAIRFPENADQTRRLRNVTQDRKAVARMQDEAASGKNKSQQATNWGTEQLLGSRIDEAGSPVPDPVSFGDGQKAKGKKEKEEADMVEAMNRDFD